VLRQRGTGTVPEQAGCVRLRLRSILYAGATLECRETALKVIIDFSRLNISLMRDSAILHGIRPIYLYNF
jgi:hypothetical protein